MSCQHEKAWLFDGSLLAVGSMNLTHNSVMRCEEVMRFIRESGAVNSFVSHFNMLWDSSQEVDVAALRKTMNEPFGDRERSASSKR